MENLKIILLCVLAAVSYGIVHDQVTARVCVEYFTIGHPPIFHTASPTLLGLGWGVIATWWVGFFLGVPLALAARCGQQTKLTARQLAPSILKLLCIMGIMALLAGILGFVLADYGRLQLPYHLANIVTPNLQDVFIADWWAHSASYLAGFVGGVVAIVLTFLRRRRAVA